jgi:hypothetical protein
MDPATGPWTDAERHETAAFAAVSSGRGAWI